MDVTIYLGIISSKRTPIPAKWKRFKLKWNDVKKTKKREKTREIKNDIRYVDSVGWRAEFRRATAAAVAI
jgi:hypothetical protein